MATSALIKINGDASNFFSEVDKIKAETATLNDTLSSAAKGGAVAFAGFTAAIGASVATFRVQEQALLRQEAVLKSTGFAAGLTAGELQKMASGLQATTTFGDEAIIQGQNLLLTFKNLGKDVFPQVNSVMLDVATAMGQDLKTTAVQLGKALNDPAQGLTALSRVGITFTDQQKEQIRTLQKSGQTAQAQTIILKELESQFGGAAQAAANGTGSFIQLGNVFGDILESVGKEFVPLLADAAKGLTTFASKINENKDLVKLLARVLAAGAGMAAFVTALSLGGIALVKIRVGLTLLRTQLNVTKIAVVGLTGALTLGLGAVIAFLPEIIQFGKDMVKAFQTAKTEIIQTFSNLADNLLNIGAKIGDFLKNLFTFNFSEIKSSAEAVRNAVSDAIDQTFKDVKTVKQKVEVQQEQEVAAQADKEAQKLANEKKLADIAVKAKKEETKMLQEEAAKQAAMEQEQLKIKKEIVELEKQGESEALIKIKQDELSALQALQKAKDQEDIELAELRLQRQIEEGEIKRQQALADQTLQKEEERALQEEFKALDDDDRALVQTKELESLNASQLQRRNSIIEASKQNVNINRKRNDQLVKDQIKHGKAVATINAALNSNEVKGAASAAGELVQLTQSKNSTLKSIGKAAAITDIIIKTGQSAMNVFQGFSTIPIVGPALGIAGAAAAVAFGTEKLGQVRKAQTGGIVPGFGSGDTVPTFLEPGEIVVPKALSPTFQQQFGNLEPDPDTAPRRNTEVNFGTVIGTEDFVKDSIIPAIRDANEFDNADLGAFA